MKKIYSIGAFVLVACSLLIWNQRRIEHARSSSLSGSGEVQVSASGKQTHRQTDAPESAPPSASASSDRYALHDRIEEAPPWTIQYGKEFWRTSPQAKEAQPPDANAPAGIDLQNIIERVSRAIRTSDDGLVANNQRYSAKFEQDGFTLTVKKPGTPAAEPLAAVRFETRSIQMGAQNIYSGDKAGTTWQVTGNTAQRQIDTSIGLIEHYEAIDEGVEVTWVLNKAPSVKAPLTIKSELSGLTYLGRDDNGLMFGDSVGEPQVRVSDVTVVDADGRRTKLEMDFQDSLLRAEIPEGLLASAAYPLAIDPTIGPWSAFPYAPNTNSFQWNPAVAANGTNFLVVWDQSNLATEGTVGGNVHGTRVSPSGLVLDPGGFAISTNGSWARAASCQGGFLVVWHHYNSGSAMLEVWGARVTGGGSVLDANGFKISNTNALHFLSLDVTANQTNYFVVWADDSNWPNSGAVDVFGTRITTGGTILDSPAIGISGSEYYDLWPRAASDGSNYIVVWWDYESDDVGVYGQKVNGGSGSLMGSQFEVCTNASSPRITWNGTATNYLVAYFAPGGLYPIVAANRLDIAGARLDGLTGFSIATEHSPWDLAVTSSGKNHVVVYNVRGDSSPDVSHGFRFFRIAASDGSILDAAGTDITANYSYASGLAIASISNICLLAWDEGAFENREDGRRDVVGALITDATLTALVPVGMEAAIAASANYVSAAGTSSSYCVAWRDGRDDGGDIYATLLTTDGKVTHPRGIPICKTNGTQHDVAVTAIGTQYFLVWLDDRSSAQGIYGARIVSGTVVETNGFLITPGACQNPDVSACGTNYLVGWNTLSPQNLLAKRVSNTGLVLDASPLTISSNNAQYAGISSIGDTNWLVVWHDNRSGFDIYGNRVTTGGSVLDGNGFVVSAATGYQVHPGVANNGTNYLVVWYDHRDTTPHIYGARVSSTGTVLDASGIAISTVTNSYYPVVASDGTEFMVAWLDNRGGLYAGRVNGAGAVLNSGGVSVDREATVSSFPNAWPDIASSGAYSYLVAYRSGGLVRSRILTVQDLMAVTLSSSQFTMRIVGASTASKVQVESSPDLTNWTLFASVSVGSDFADTSVTGVNARFYRAHHAQGRIDSAVGFYRITVPGTNASGYGFFLAVNQLDNPTNNTVPTLLAGVPTNTEVYTWNGGFVTNKWNGSTWTDTTSPIDIGTGFFISNPSSNSFTVGFFGRIRQGGVTQSAAGSASTWMGSPIPHTSNFDILPYPATGDDQVTFWNPATQGYAGAIMYFTGFGWYDGSLNPDPGSLDIGEGCILYNAGGAKTWTHTFSVW